MDYLIFIATLLVITGSIFYNQSTFFSKLVNLCAVMLGTTLIVSVALNLVPGDPLDHILGELAESNSREIVAKKLKIINEDGSTISIIGQYSNFVQSFFSNNLKSFITDRPTFNMLFERLPYTIFLAIFAMLVAIFLGPIFGVFAALNQNRWPDYLLSFFALVGISVPGFFLAPVLLIVFSIKLHLLPINGADDGLLSVILPSFSLGIALAAMLARMSRASMLEVISQDYIRTAKAKGLSFSKIYFKHALRNSLIPVVTLIGLQFGVVLTGTVITEKIFNWPGIGLLLLESIQKLDLPVVQTCVLFIAFIYSVINMLTDVVYGLIDPRIKIGSKNEYNS